MIVGDFESVRTRRGSVTIFNGDTYGRTNIVAEGDAERPGPHAFLVEQSPGIVLPSHFHMNDQFQVVVAGSGRLGRHPIAPIAVHYARGKTGYGPIVADGDGLWYLTLRARLEYGAHYLADPKTQIDRTAPKFHATSGQHPVEEAQAARQRPAPERVEVLPATADGLGAWIDRLPPGAALPPRAPHDDAPGPGCFRVIVGGSATLDGAVLRPWSCLWSDAGEPAPALVAGADGVEVLALRFPKRTD